MSSLMSPRRPAARAIAIAVSVVAATSTSIFSARAQSAHGALPRPAPVAALPMAEREDQNRRVVSVVVPATVQAFFSTDIFAKDSGYITQVNNDIGDHVRKGQVLAVIEDPELRAQLDKARAAVRQAAAALDVAKRQLAGMEADLALREVTLKRQRELFASNYATGQALDEARARQGVSNANLETGKAKITSAEADLEMAKAEAERLQALLQYDSVVAPFDGVVTRRLVNPGDLVQAATSTRTGPLFTCQQLDVVRIFADAPETSAAGIRPGLPADVKVYGPDGVTVRGMITRVASALDSATRTMRVEIDLPNAGERLLPGSYAQVTLQLAPEQTNSARSRSGDE